MLGVRAIGDERGFGSSTRTCYRPSAARHGAPEDSSWVSVTRVLLPTSRSSRRGDGSERRDRAVDVYRAVGSGARGAARRSTLRRRSLLGRCGSSAVMVTTEWRPCRRSTKRSVSAPACYGASWNVLSGSRAEGPCGIHGAVGPACNGSGRSDGRARANGRVDARRRVRRSGASIDPRVEALRDPMPRRFSRACAPRTASASVTARAASTRM